MIVLTPNDRRLAMVATAIASLTFSACSPGKESSPRGDAGTDSSVTATSVCVRPGQLDPSFGMLGIAAAGFEGGQGWLTAIAQDRGGGLVAVGASNGGYAAARFDPSGQLDRSFGAGGKVSVYAGDGCAARAIVITADEKLVLAGDALEGSDASRKTFGLLRLNSNGTVDSTFGGQGIVRTDVGAPAKISKLRLQGDGRLLAAGSATKSEGGSVAALTRYLADGSLDTEFQGGTVLTDLPASKERVALALYADGRVLLAASDDADKTGPIRVVRYNADGTPDSTFNGGTPVTFSAGAKLRDVAIAANQTAVIAADNGVLVTTRLLENGSLDSTFGDGGQITETEPAWAETVVLQGENVLVSSGWQDGDGWAMSVVRYLQSGARDETFGDRGLSKTRAHYNDYATAMLLQADGKVVVAGPSSPANWDHAAFVALRLCP